jgi:hypothetical protein
MSPPGRPKGEYRSAKREGLQWARTTGTSANAFP